MIDCSSHYAHNPARRDVAMRVPSTRRVAVVVADVSAATLAALAALARG